MSSAILYVAIVVIWACVLIPRWLRHSSASTVAAQAQDEAAADSTAEEESSPSRAPALAPRRRREDAPALASAPRRRREDVPAPRERRAATVPVSDEAPADPGRRRLLSARRRLLLMLVGLGIASGVLAGARMAAWWVVVPPSVMLLGYLPLLRAAARADSERGEMARYRKAQAAAEAVRASARRPVPAASASGPTASASGPTASASGPTASASGPVASGARIIAIPAAPGPAEEEIYDQYADAKLRAVGD